MPVMNRLQGVLRKHGIQNSNQLKRATRKADSKKKGLGQATSLSAWNDPFWVPTAPTLQLICKTFNIQPGDFLFYVPDEPTNFDALQMEDSRPAPKIPRLDAAIEIARHLGITLQELARSVGLNP